MTPLPPGWISTHLGDVASTQLGRMLSARRETGIHAKPYLRNRDVQWGRINVVDLPTMDFDPESGGRFQLSQGDVLVCEGGEVGRAAVWNDQLAECYYQKALHRVRTSEALAPEYLRYLLEHYARTRAFEQFTSGSTIAHLPQEDLRNLPVNLPPRPEQDRIVAIIEEQFSRVDAGMGALGRIRRELERMRAAVLQSAVTGKLVPFKLSDVSQSILERISSARRSAWKEVTQRPYREPAVAHGTHLQLPPHWSVASLEAITHPVRVICYGILMPRVREGGCIPYVEVKDLRARTLGVDALHRTSVEMHSAFPRSVLEAGDVVLAIRGSFDRALVVPPDVAGSNVSRDVARIAPLADVNARFLAAYLTSPPALRYLRDRARGVAVKGVNIADLRAMPVPIPPYDEQAAIAAAVDYQFDLVEQLELTVDTAERRGSSLRSSILAAAFSGSLVPQHPDEEPAAMLLERSAKVHMEHSGQRRAPVSGRHKKVTT